MNTNAIIIEFIRDNWIAIVLISLSSIPIFSQKIASGLSTNTFINPITGTEEKTPRLSLIRLAIQMVILYPLGDAMVIWQQKSTLSVAIFIIVAFSIGYTREVTPQVTILVSISIIALYSEQMMSKAKCISFMVFKWERHESKADAGTA